jgi:polysaccharide biosynthesis/export protein
MPNIRDVGKTRPFSLGGNSFSEVAMFASVIDARRAASWVVLLLGLSCTGCYASYATPFWAMCPIPRSHVPNEATKMMLPPYVIEPPDVLSINAVQLVPKPPYKIKPLDIFSIQYPADLAAVKDIIEDLVKTGRTLSGNYSVNPDGTFDLGSVYGKVDVVGLTVDEAQKVIEKRLKARQKPEIVELGKVSVALVQSRGLQQILGSHLVRPDGTVGLGTYGGVAITGLTIAEAKQAIEAHLSEYVLNPEISLEVAGFNSKVYYVIYDGAGYGETVIRIPAYGNETVLDAIASVNGLSSVASRRRIWIARPGFDDHPDTIIPVDWKAITRGGAARINYQVFPGDRIYVQAQPLITLDTYIARVLTPMERIMGGIILGVGTYNSLIFAGQSGGIGGTGTGGGGTGV